MVGGWEMALGQYLMGLDGVSMRRQEHTSTHTLPNLRVVQQEHMRT
jgi:hypothetical protein